MNRDGTGPGVHGQVVTFYSYKGGTGRTMALANVAWILAANGKRVLVVDWDLESPGLHRYFPPTVLDPAALSATPGVVDMIRDFEWAMTHNGDMDPTDWYRNQSPLLGMAISLRWPFPAGGHIHFVSAGLQNGSYSAAVASLDWDRFYADLGGGLLFDALRADMREHYDYTLIDSRTGFSDVADICTIHLPDVLVDCFTLNNQSIDGAAEVARAVAAGSGHRRIRILPVPMRVDDAEKEKADAGRAVARARFEGFPEIADPGAVLRYWGAVEIPYHTFYGYEEILAVFGDSPGLSTSLLAAYERFTGVLTGDEVISLPPLEENQRLAVLNLVARKRERWAPEEYTVAYVAEDRMWSEWVAALLRQAGFPVTVHLLTAKAAPVRSAHDRRRRLIVIMSAAFASSYQAMAMTRALAGTDQLLVLRVAETQGHEGVADVPTVDVSGLSERPAADRLLRAVGITEPGAWDVDPAVGARFPAVMPRIWSIPSRNASFTGRAEELEKLRDGIVGGLPAVILPLALHGLGGVGKTQLALEYAHRFKADYDLVWWVDAEQPAAIDASLAELAVRLGLRTAENVPDAAGAVREALRRGEPYGRWLIVYDNALEPAMLTPYLPDLPSAGTGHILITSRIQAWSQAANSLEVDVFSRQESIEHLTRRVPGMPERDADAIADLVGDLPLAVESAASWLATTGTPAAHYLAALAEETTRVLSLSTSDRFPASLAVTWNLAIERLREREPAAVRLLQIAAFMNPDGIAMDLVLSGEMVAALRPFNAFVTERMVIGNIVREIGQLSLLKVDSNTSTLRIHRLVQDVVRDQLDEEQKTATLHEVHRILAGARPHLGDVDDPATWPRYQFIWPHLTPSRAVDCEDEAVRQLLIDRVRFLRQTGDYRNAMEFGRTLEARWADRIAGLGADTPAGLALYRQQLSLEGLLASVLRLQGQYQSAYDLDAEVLAEQQRVLPSRHPHTLITAMGLAGDLRGLGRFREALDMDAATYEDHKAVFWEDHPVVLSAASNLAISYQLVGDLARAREIDQDTLARRRSVLGHRHPSTLYSAANLARDLREMGHYQLSVELLRSTLADVRDVLGESSPETLRTAKSLAISLRRAGHLEEAHALSRDTYDRYLADYQSHDPDVLACALNLAADISTAGDLTAAVRIAQAVLQEYRERLGGVHPCTLICLNNLATYSRRAGLHKQALELGESARSGFASMLGDKHPHVLAATANAANSLADAGDLDQAQALGRETAEAFRALLGNEHPDALAAAANLAVILKVSEQAEEAEAVRDRVLSVLSVTLGDDHPNTQALHDWRRVDWDLEPQLS